MERNDLPASKILSTLFSERPLTETKAFLGLKETLSTVLKPASTNFLMSPDVIPNF